MAQALFVQMLAGKNISFTVHAPGFVSTNGDLSEDGKTVKWIYPLSELMLRSGENRTIELRAEISGVSPPGSTLGKLRTQFLNREFIFWPVGTLLIILFIGIILWLMRLRRSSRNHCVSQRSEPAEIRDMGSASARANSTSPDPIRGRSMSPPEIPTLPNKRKTSIAPTVETTLIESMPTIKTTPSEQTTQPTAHPLMENSISVSGDGLLPHPDGFASIGLCPNCQEQLIRIDPPRKRCPHCKNPLIGGA